MNAHVQIPTAQPKVRYETLLLLTDGLAGYSEATLREARDLAALIDEAERLGAIHTQLEEARASKRKERSAEIAWQRAWDHAREASAALLTGDAAGPDVTARLIIHLRERSIALTPRHKCRPMALPELIEHLSSERVCSELSDIAPALAYAAKHLPSAAYDHQAAINRAHWAACREKARATLDALSSAPKDSTDEEADPLFDAAAVASEAWETLTPPDFAALLEVARFTLGTWGDLKTWQSADDPRTMRDLLDSGRQHSIMVARWYMHLLRLTGSDSPALLTPPIAGLFPAFDEGTGFDDMEARWEEHHRLAEPHPTRVAEFAEWVMPELTMDRDEVGIAATWAYSKALHDHAKDLIEEYEALGGAFTVTIGPDGKKWFGRTFARDGGGRSDEILALVNRHRPLRKTIANLIEQRSAQADAVRQAAE